MKSYFLLFCFFIFGFKAFSQVNINSFLGSNGIFKTLQAENITETSKLSFDLRLTVKSTAIGASKKVNVVTMYLNTKNGFVGIDSSLNKTELPDENNSGLVFLVETMTKESFKYTNDSGIKIIEKLATDLVNSYNNLPFKKMEESVAKSKKYLNNTITALPYIIDKMGIQKKHIRYCYGTDYPLFSIINGYLGSYGVGFYNIDGSTFLCVATEHKFMNMEIIKIEKVNFKFNPSTFKTKNKKF